jgi:hypothetical protein
MKIGKNLVSAKSKKTGQDDRNAPTPSRFAAGAPRRTLAKHIRFSNASPQKNSR